MPGEGVPHLSGLISCAPFPAASLSASAGRLGLHGGVDGEKLRAAAVFSLCRGITLQELTPAMVEGGPDLVAAGVLGRARPQCWRERQAGSGIVESTTVRVQAVASKSCRRLCGAAVA